MADGKDKKKTTNDKVDNDLNFDDLEELGEGGMDFGSDFDSGPDREPSRSKVAKELAKEAGTGFFESLIKKTTKDALPDQYSSSYNDAMDIYGFAGEVVDRNKEKLNKTMFKLGREVKKVLPFKLSMLDKYLEAQEANFQSYKQQSEEEVRNAGIQSELSSIFDKQLDVHKALEARREAKDDVSKKEQLVQSKMSMDVLSNIDLNVARQTSFTVEISKQFYRKSLEIQFKTYFVQADMLRTMRDSYKAFSIQFTNIEKNTSLPEFVKLKNTERLQDILRTQATQSVYNQLFENSKFVDGMKKRLSGFVDQKVDDVTNTVDNFTDMLGNLTGGAEAGGTTPMAMIGTIASSMFGGTMGEKLASKISPKIKEKIKGNKSVNTGANYLNMLSNSPSTLVQTLRERVGKKEEELDDESSPGRWVGSKVMKGLGSLLDVASPIKPDAAVKQLGYLDHNQPAIFDNKVHRSISEVIPMYLARILKQNTDLTSMYQQANSDKVKNPDTEIVNYDFANRTLLTNSAIKKNVESELFANKSTEKRSRSISHSILAESKNSYSTQDLGRMDKMKLNRTLTNSSSEKLLTAYIEQAKKQKGVDLSYDSLIANYEKNATLKDIVSKNPELEKLIKVVRDSKAKMPTYVDTSMKDLRAVYPLEGIKKLFLESSKLAKASIPHTLSDEVALVFSRAFGSYILLTGRDVDSQSVANRKAFTFMKEEDVTDKVTNSLVVFMDDVKRIRNTDDMLINSSLDVLFGLMNYSIKQNINIDPKVYQNLAELYPGMVSKGQLSIENIAEGKLTPGGNQKYITFETLSDITKTSRVEINQSRKEITMDNFIDKAYRSGSERLKQLTDALKATNGNPAALAELLIKSARNFQTSVSEKVKTNFKELNSNLNKAYEGIAKISDRAIRASIPGVIKNLNTSVANIDRRIELLQVDMAERSAEIARVSSEIAEVTNSPSADKPMQRFQKSYTTYASHEIKALQEVKKSMLRQINTLTEIANSEENMVKANMVRIRNSVKTTVDEMKATLHDLEQRGKELKLDSL